MKTMSNTPEEMPDNATDRPLVTFALFAYNQEQYIREAVEGAFAQTYEPLEIILSDDCSSDRTFEIMQEMAAAYEGPHEVRVRQSEVNFGIARHFDTVMRIASGNWVLVAAGDDISNPARTAACVNVALSHGDLGVIEIGCKNFSGGFNALLNNDTALGAYTSNLRVFSLKDVLDGSMTGLIGAGRAYARDAYTKFSPLLDDCPAEDTPALFRCLYECDGVFVDHELVGRRIHSENLSSVQSLSKMNFSILTDQYFCDLQSAFHMRLIDQSMHLQLVTKFRKYAFRKQCASDVHTGFRGEIRPSDVIKSRFFSTREKIYLLRKGFIARMRYYG